MHDDSTASVYKRRVTRTTRDRREPTMWIGLVTLLVVLIIASVLAIAVQFGMGVTYYDYLRPLNYIFFGAGFPGVLAGAMAESSGHGLDFHLHVLGKTICPYVNAAVYAIVILLWLKFWGDSRLIK